MLHLHVLSQLILTIPVGRHCYSHFKDKGIEASGCEETLPQLRARKWQNWDYGPILPESTPIHSLPTALDCAFLSPSFLICKMQELSQIISQGPSHSYCRASMLQRGMENRKGISGTRQNVY